jgi:hypothetical protein
VSAEALRTHLVASGLAGNVRTTPRQTLDNCLAMLRGEAPHTLGLSDWRSTTLRDALLAVQQVCGGDLHANGEAWAPVPPGAPPDIDGPGFIAPSSTIAAVQRHRERLAGLAREPGMRVVIGTGHPTGLLAHYQAISRRLQAAGAVLLTPAEGRQLRIGADGRPRELRYLDGVACVSDGASLRHTHASTYMEALLDETGGGLGAIDLVIADHGFAGAAIERGLPTLSIADVNDVALPLAQARGHTDGVLPIDDNLAPRTFVRVTEAMLNW